MARVQQALFIILTVALSVAASPVYLGWFPAVHARNVNISLVANVNGWNYTQPSGKNPTITVLETDTVSISFTASDALQHRFYVDEDRNGLPDCYSRDECSAVFNSTSPTNQGWAPGVIPIGTYHYYDSYNQATTNGTLIVQPGPYPATAHITLIASPSGWNYTQPSGLNPTITVYYAQNVNLKFTTTDPPSIQHRFYIDIDKNGVPDCTGQDYCDVPFNSTVIAGSYWGSGYLPPGTYHYYDMYYPAVSNGTFIILAGVPPDYTISTNPSSLTIMQGQSQTSQVNVKSENNFTGTVSLTASPSGVTTTLNPTSVTLPKNGIATSTLNVTAPAYLATGTYQVGVTASNGTTQRSTVVYVQVIGPDFTITTNTNTLNIVQGSSSTATITVTSLNGFSGKVSLQDQTTPNGPASSQNPPTLTLASGGSQSSTLTVSTAPTTQTGSYSITVTGSATGTNGQLTHSLAIALTVTPPASPPPATKPTNSLLSTYLFEIIAAVIMAVSLIALIAKRRSSKHKSQNLPNSPMQP